MALCGSSNSASEMTLGIAASEVWGRDLAICASRWWEKKCFVGVMEAVDSVDEGRLFFRDKGSLYRGTLLRWRSNPASLELGECGKLRSEDNCFRDWWKGDGGGFLPDWEFLALGENVLVVRWVCKCSHRCTCRCPESSLRGVLRGELCDVETCGWGVYDSAVSRCRSVATAGSLVGFRRWVVNGAVAAAVVVEVIGSQSTWWVLQYIPSIVTMP